MECFVGTPERDEGMSRTGGNGKAAQFGVARARQPGEERMTDAGAQRLLGRPERIVPAGGADHRELGEIGTGRGERRRVRQVRRREPQDALARRGQRGERGDEKAELADGPLAAKDLGQRGGRPPAAGQFGVECRETRRQAGRRARQACAAPDALRAEDVIEGGGAEHTVLIYSITCRPSTSVAGEAAITRSML